MPEIINRVRAKAEELSGEGVLDYRTAFLAFDDVLGPHAEVSESSERGILAFFAEHLFLLAAIALTITFGVLGLWKQGGNGAPQGFLDIAKIFAGAVVGGAAASSTPKSRPTTRSAPRPRGRGVKGEPQS